MSDKQFFRLVHPTARQMAMRAITHAPEGFVCEVKPATRSLNQNARLWAMLGDVASQVEWHGRYLTPDEWKDVFSAALHKQSVVPGIDGGFVVLGQRTSKMSKREMSDLQELISAFGAERGVRFSEPQQGMEDMARGMV